MWIETRAGETLLIVGVLAIALIFFFWVVPAGTQPGGGTALTPRFILDVVVFITLSLCLVRLVKLWLRPVSQTAEEVDEDAGDGEKRHFGRIAVIFGGCLLYSYALIDIFGFYVSSILLVVGFFVILGERRLPILIIYPITTSFLLYAVFEIAFDLRLPKGTLIPPLLSI